MLGRSTMNSEIPMTSKSLPYSTDRVMDVLSGTASFEDVIDISVKTTGLCSQYLKASRDAEGAKDGIDHLRRKVIDITHILEKLEQLLVKEGKWRLSPHGLID